jgi:hypothetical protein
MSLSQDELDQMRMDDDGAGSAITSSQDEQQTECELHFQLSLLQASAKIRELNFQLSQLNTAI